MHRSLLTPPLVNVLLAQARKNKETDGQVMPVVLLANRTRHLTTVELPDLAADADARRAQFYAIGRQFLDTIEAVFVCESWIAPPSSVAPCEHPGREEAIIPVGHNRDRTKGMFARQVFSKKNNRIMWQQPNIIVRPGCAQGLLDLVFAP
jgi:hypothetical protein